jgi:hypothetical protein
MAEEADATLLANDEQEVCMHSVLVLFFFTRCCAQVSISMRTCPENEYQEGEEPAEVP